MSAEPWTYTAGNVGDLRTRVTAFEDFARKGVVYLKWRPRRGGNYRFRSLGHGVRQPNGRLDKARIAQAVEACNDKYNELQRKGEAPALVPVRTPLTIREGWSLATDREKGKWKEDSPHRREIARAVARAEKCWGKAKTWNSVERADIRQLWMRVLKDLRKADLTGARTAFITVSRILALATWLRDEGRIALVSRNAEGREFTPCTDWKDRKAEMEKDIGDYEVKRPRYSLEESRAMLVAAWEVDPRYALCLELGAEYRLGQVVRLKRSHLDRERGRFTIKGAGKKRGEDVFLTDGQRAHLERELTTGYLAGLEAAYQANEIADYPMFPGGRIMRDDGRIETRAEHATRGFLTARPLRYWHNETETLARVDGKPIKHIEGRGWYGMRRNSVDFSKKGGISREGLRAFGGWADSQVPDAIYAEQEQEYAREEAAAVRAKLRGEDGAIPTKPAKSGAKTEQARSAKKVAPRGQNSNRTRGNKL